MILRWRDDVSHASDELKKQLSLADSDAIDFPASRLRIDYETRAGCVSVTNGN
jgi:hypothetical protein